MSGRGNGQNPGAIVPLVAAVAAAATSQAAAQPITEGGAAVDAPIAANPGNGAQARLNVTGRTLSLPMSLVLDGARLGDVVVTLDRDDRVALNGDEVAAALEPALSPEAAARLRAAFTGRSALTLPEIAEAGLQARLDGPGLAIALTSPPEMRPVNRISLGAGESAIVGAFDKPAKVSAYLNVRANLDYAHSGDAAGLADPSGTLDGAARLRGLVFETEGDFTAAEGGGVRRDGSRIVYDDLKRVARWTLGDLQPGGRSFQSAPSIAGLGVQRTYSELQPQRVSRPQSQQRFTLRNAATVEAFVNGEPVRRLRLEPGVYDLRDFPFAQGVNSVDLRISDDTGVTETLSFSLFLDRALLEKGMTEFGAAAGVRTVPTNDGVSYGDEWVATGYARRGFSDRLSAGLTIQASATTGQVGAEALLGTRFGAIGIDAAYSHDQDRGAGYAVNVGFNRYFQAEANRFRSINLAVETRSENFTGVAERAQTNPYAALLAVSYSQSLGPQRYVSLNVDRSMGRGAEPDATNVQAALGLRLTDRLNLQLDARRAIRIAREETSARISLAYRFADRSSLRTSYDFQEQRTQIGAQTNRGRGVGAFSAALDADVGPDMSSLNGSVFYTANRAEISAAHTATMAVGGGTVEDQRTSMRVAGAIAFADGLVGLSRPIANSFALAAPHRSLKSPVTIEPVEQSFEARSGLFGAAALPGLSAYAARTITFDAPKAPPGYDLGAGALRVSPPYRAGYALRLGSDYALSLIGRLLNRSGGPVSLIAGTATETNVRSGRTVSVFTNRDGRFAAAGLRPGTWRIDMDTPEGPLAYTLTIEKAPKDDAALLRIGDLRPS